MVRYGSNDKHKRRFWDEHDRESYVCPECGDGSGPFQVHHKDLNVSNGSIDNLTALCKDCHWDKHRGVSGKNTVEGWKEAFREELLDS